MCLIMAVGLFVLSVSVVALADMGKTKYKTRNTARIVALAGVSLQTGYFCATAGGSTVVQVCMCVWDFPISYTFHTFISFFQLLGFPAICITMAVLNSMALILVIFINRQQTDTTVVDVKVPIF
jgi:hypothetical protein